MSDLTLTVGELLDAVRGLQGIGSVTIPNVVAAYALAKAKKKANPELETIEAQRLALCEKHGGVVVNGSYEFSERRAAFDADWKALRAEPVTLSGVRAVTVAELDGAQVSPDTLFALGPFVVDAPESA